MDSYLNLARKINYILKEDNEILNLGKNAKEVGNKLLNAINNTDFTTDKATEGIYYALSSFLSLSIIMSHIPLVPRVISTFTSNHLNTNVLPKYRSRLLNVYRGKIKSIDEEIEKLKDKIDDENEGDMNEKIENLRDIKSKLERDCERLKVVK